MPFWVFLAAAFGSALGAALGVVAGVAFVLWLDRPAPTHTNTLPGNGNDPFRDLSFLR